MEDTESGLIEDYEAQISATARELRTDFSADLTDLETGLTNSFESSISQTAKEIRAEVSAVEEDLDGKISKNASSITQTASAIRSEVSSIEEDLDGKIEKNSSAITQTAKEIRAEVSEIEEDLDGRITENTTEISAQAGEITTLTSRTNTISGRVTNTETVMNQHTKEISLKASQTSVDTLTDRVTKAEAEIKVNADNISLKVSKDGVISSINQSSESITINASKIDLVGKVTFNDLASVVQSTINGKVNTSTIISGNYIKTSLIDVDELTVSKLEASNSEGWKLKMDSGGFVCENSSGTPLLEINADGMQPAIGIYKSGTGNLLLNALGVSYSPSSGGVTAIDSKGLTLASGAKLYNFALGNVSSGYPSITTDFTVMSSSSSLPSASSCKGKVIFIKFNGSKTLSGSIFPRNSTSTVSSVTHNNLSAFYISNGSYWYEFLSVD